MNTRLTHKPTMDASGNWVMRPFVIWRDETGLHDRPATIKDGASGVDVIIIPKRKTA